MENVLPISSMSDFNQVARMSETLSGYTEKHISEDGMIKEDYIETEYFFKNDRWQASFFSDIPQFNGTITHIQKAIHFDFLQPLLNLEAKYIVYNKIFSGEWSINNVVANQDVELRRVREFLQAKYPQLISFLELSVEQVSVEWIKWLDNGVRKTIAVPSEQAKLAKGAKYPHKTQLVLFLPNICRWLRTYLDERDEWDEWEKDCWDVRKLTAYGIHYNKTALCYYMHFEVIRNKEARECTKAYLKRRLMGDGFAWNTAKCISTICRPFSIWLLIWSHHGKISVIWKDGILIVISNGLTSILQTVRKIITPIQNSIKTGH
jgi:hypothetical protein